MLRHFAVSFAVLAVLAACAPSEPESTDDAATSDAPEGADFADAEIRANDLGDGVHMLQGVGGNVALIAGPDGAVLIDDEMSVMGEKLLAAVRNIAGDDVRYVLNTHWHFDHVGNNERVADTGAVIVAHNNVRRRMSSEQFVEALEQTFPPSPAGALPVVTFTRELSLHLNAQPIDVHHIRYAHTDGDAIIHLPQANVIHAGDTYWNGFYPLIDLSSGGSIDGMIRAADFMLELSDDETRIIPGHGPLSGRAELLAYRDMLATVRERVMIMLERELSRPVALGSTALEEFNAEWGDGFVPPDQFLGIVYDDLITK